MRLATISSKGQITLPRGFLNDLHLKPNDKVMVKVTQGSIQIEPVEGSVVKQVSGSLNKHIDPKKLGKPLSEIMDETIKKAAKEIAEEA